MADTWVESCLGGVVVAGGGGEVHGTGRVQLKAKNPLGSLKLPDVAGGSQGRAYR